VHTDNYTRENVLNYILRDVSKHGAENSRSADDGVEYRRKTAYRRKPEYDERQKNAYIYQPFDKDDRKVVVVLFAYVLKNKFVYFYENY